MLGHCLSRQHKTKESLKAFQRAAEIDPDDPNNLYNIGDAFLGLGQPEKAVDPLLQAVQLKHDYSLAHYDLSLAFLRLKKYQEAEMSARAALRDDPEMAFQWSNLGMGATGNLGLALMNQGRMEEAEACFRRNLGLVRNRPISISASRCSGRSDTLKPLKISGGPWSLSRRIRSTIISSVRRMMNWDSRLRRRNRCAAPSRSIENYAHRLLRSGRHSCETRGAKARGACSLRTGLEDRPGYGTGPITVSPASMPYRKRKNQRWHSWRRPFRKDSGNSPISKRIRIGTA